MILPVTAIREVLDAGAVWLPYFSHPQLNTICLKECCLDLVALDSRFLRRWPLSVPQEVPLTSFSVLLSAAKALLRLFGRSGCSEIFGIGDRILMLESCTHPYALFCDDIGRGRFPALIRKVSGKKVEFDFIAGLDPIPTERRGSTVSLFSVGGFKGHHNLTALSSGQSDVGWCSGNKLRYDHRLPKRNTR